MANVDPITLEIVRARLDGIVREMEVAVFRTGYSTIVRESHDFSCGLLDRDGRVVGTHRFGALGVQFGETLRRLVGQVRDHRTD